MPIAELRGKLSRDVCRREDTLTGGVFDLLTVLPSGCLCGWLAKARRADGRWLTLATEAIVDGDFWPDLEERGGGTCQPDALVTLTSTRETLGLLVEVKYKSEMSGWPTPTEDPEVRSQLGREWMVLQALEPHRLPGQPLRLDRRVLIYVTVDAVLPHATFDVVAKELARKGTDADADAFLASAYWLSWFCLSDVVSTALGQPALAHESRTGLSRLHDLLAARRLCAFSGLSAPTWSGTVPWAYDSRRPYAVFGPPAHRVAWSYSKESEVSR